MKGSRSRLLPPLVASVALLAHVTLLYKAVLRHTGGNVSYPVDDTFIHLALAKQLAMNGVYGVTPHEFTAASSSIGWPFLLAALMKLTGATPWLPLLLNGAIAVVLFVAIERAVHRLAPDASVVSATLVALAAMALTPMGTLVVLGMEHTAHAAATVAFVTMASSWLADADADADARASWRRALPIAGLAFATTLWRYEGMFPVALVVALAFARRRARLGAMIAAGGALPIVLFGLYSRSHGAHFLPTPVLLKGRHFDFNDLSTIFDLLGGDLLDRFGTEGYALAVAVACAALAFLLGRRDGFWSTNVLALLLTLGMIALHLELASVGWFFRYESYFLATGITVAGASLVNLLPPRVELWKAARAQRATFAAAVVGLVILAAPLFRRAMLASDITPLACRNIYEQQMQSARFLEASFPHERVAVNDIGAVAWVGNDRVIDLVGLATLPVAEAKGLKLDQPLTPADVVRLTEGVKVAIVYDDWFKENLPATWLRVGRWKIADNKSCAFATVSIYATESASYPRVIEALRSFAAGLPKHVTGDGRYTDAPTAPERLRTGDRIDIATSSAEVSGAYEIEADGTIPLRKIGHVAVRGLALEGAATELQLRVGAMPSPLHGTKIERVTRIASRPASACVAGHVSRSGEVPASPFTLDAAIAAAGHAPGADPAMAWVWREKPTGFVKMTRAELEAGALVDGDLVVVPTLAGASGGGGDGSRKP